VVVLGFSGTPHGFSHSFLGAILFAIAIGCLGYFIFKKGIALKFAVFSALVGTFFHVVFDSFVYSDIRPFYPLEWNPFLGFLSLANVQWLCIALFIAGAAAYFLKEN
jgi:membrane-bound metal-dependent hydrolase YbcI (DUF457 family)